MFAASLVGCAAKETAVIPTCPAAVVVAPATPAVDVSPPAPAAAEESEPDEEEEPDGVFFTRELGNITVMVRADEIESDDAQIGDAHLRIEITRDGVETVDVVERDIDAGACLVAHLELDVDTIFSDGETLVFEANYRCVFGEEITHISIEHIVIAAFEHNPGLSVLYEGTSEYINNRGLAVSLDKREFYVELDAVAVYRHTVEWCDDKGMKLLLGQEAGCGRTSPRKLKLLERVPIAVPMPND